MAEPTTSTALVFVVLMTISGTFQVQGEKEPYAEQNWKRLHVADEAAQPTMEECENEKPRTISRWQQTAEYVIAMTNPVDPLYQNERRWVLENVEGQCIGIPANVEIPTDQRDN